MKTFSEMSEFLVQDRQLRLEALHQFAGGKW